jgi:capreomycidine synthase
LFLPKAALEHWMRDYYFDCEIDLGSSGVYAYDFGEVARLAGIKPDDLYQVVLNDSLTVGSLPLRQALADRYGNGDAESVMTANGSNEMLFHLLSTLLEAGDEVIALEPIYHALDAVAISKSCHIKRWNMSESEDFRVCFDELGRLVTDKTKLIAVNFPHNPTGVSITAEQQKQLIDIAESVDAFLVWDAAFDELVAGEPLRNPFLSYHKAISVGTLSKCYGMPGLRVGWCFANKDVIQKSVGLRDYTTLYISPIIELIATKVIENADVFIGKRKMEVTENKAILEKWLIGHQGAVSWSVPQGGVSCLIQINGVSNMDDFCRAFADKYSVMLVPGSCFGKKTYARLGYGESTDKFVKGLEYLTTFINEYEKKTDL